MNTTIESASLAFCDIPQGGTSDKVYHLALQKNGAGYLVTAQYGRRGSALATDNKTKNGALPFDDAKKIFDRVLREKKTKGYIDIGAKAPVVVPVPAGHLSQVTCHSQELLEEIPAESAMLALVSDERYWMQDKSDGHSRGVVKTASGEMFGLNKTGGRVPLTADLIAALSAWGIFDKRKTAGFRVARMSTGYGSCYRTIVDSIVTKDRKAALWQGVKSCLANAMKPLGNVGDVPFYETDMKRVAKLISFPFDERKRAADEKIRPPKTWGPVNIHTLEPVKERTLPLTATARAGLFALRCTRGGAHHYVTGETADAGKWTKNKSKARLFTATDAKTAKGKSKAEIVPILDAEKSPSRKRLGELMKKRWAARRGIKASKKSAKSVKSVEKKK